MRRSSARRMRRSCTAILFLVGISTAAVAQLPPLRTASASRPAVVAPVAASIFAIQARPDGDDTLLEVILREGSARPTLSGEGRRFLLTVPGATPAPGLGENIRSGGLVSRIELEVPATESPESRIHLETSEAALARLVPGPDSRTYQIRLATAGRASVQPIRNGANRLYDVDANQTDYAALVKSLARDAGVNVVLAGNVNTKVTATLRQVSIEQALDLLSKSAGLSYHRDGETYVVGSVQDIDTAYPKPPAPVTPPAVAPAPVIRHAIYRCQHIQSEELAKVMATMFGADGLKVSAGASPISPRLDTGQGDISKTTGAESSALKGSIVGSDSRADSRLIVVSGETGLVDRALAVAQQLDVRRAQVRIGVQITDINLEALRELGIQWSFGSVAISDRPSNGINFGRFTRTGLNIEAELNALQKNDQAKLLAAPTISLLDGERGFILIGERIKFPTLVGYTQAQTPIFDIEEERAGIYLQVAAQMSGDNEVTLTLYPQVSVVSGFLNINGASYPQITTREQQTTIRVRDGEKVIVGGLIRDDEIENVQRVPLLSQIPIFGELFTYRKKNRRKSEVVITITPQILRD